jgi:NodT family efflux transporter outer membrane factor (OMF) lipoprotein
LRTSIGLAAWPALALLAGCTVGPNFHPPEAGGPLSWFAWHQPAPPSRAVKSVPVEQNVDTRWWTLFGDPELTALEQRVAAQNLDVRTATVRLAESRAQRQVVGADQYPQLNGNASYTRERPSSEGVFSAFGGNVPAPSSPGTTANGQGLGVGPPVSTFINPFDLWQYGLDASWELDLWGRVRREVESADASVEASEEARRGALLSAVAEVARDYLQLRGIQETLRITQQNLTTAQQSLQLTRERAVGGLGNDLDVANAQAQVQTVQSQIPNLEQQRDQTINAIALLLGEQPGALANELVPPRPIPPVPATVPVGLPSELARRRPDIRQAEAQLHSSTADIGVAQAAFYPTITLSGSMGIQALQFKDLGSWAGAGQYAFGPSLTLPIFEGGRLTGTLHLRERQQQEAAVTYQKTVLQAWHDIDDALLAYSAEQRRRDRLGAAVASNQTALRLARQRYAEGLSTFLDVLTAQQNLLQAQQQYADSTATVCSDLVALYKALGGGWEADFPVSTADAR